MAHFESLLPLNASATEKAIDQLAHHTLEVKIKSELVKVDLHPLTCLPHLLPYLAYQWQVNINDMRESEQRQLILNALEIHKYKGTVYAVKKALASVFERSSIEEFTGERVFEFDANVELKSDINAHYGAAKFTTARKLINNAKNARSRLVNFKIEMPQVECDVHEQTAAALHLDFSNSLHWGYTTHCNLHSNLKWDLTLGE